MDYYLSEVSEILKEYSQIKNEINLLNNQIQLLAQQKNELDLKLTINREKETILIQKIEKETGKPVNFAKILKQIS